MTMARPVYPSDSADKTLVRFPDGMRDLLREEAKKNNRSLNAEIIERLEYTLTRDRVNRRMDKLREPEHVAPAAELKRIMQETMENFVQELEDRGVFNAENVRPDKPLKAAPTKADKDPA